jgi:hypothetical protein
MAKKRLTREMMKEAARLFGREGGQKRKASLSPERRSEIASAAAKAGWRKRLQDKPATTKRKAKG